MILKEIEEVSLKLGEELWKICFYKDDLSLFLTDHKIVDEDLVDIIFPFSLIITLMTDVLLVSLNL